MRGSHAQAAERLAAAGAQVQRLDLETPGELQRAVDGCDAIVFTNNLRLTARAMAELASPDIRLIAFSSNNVAVHGEAQTYQALKQAESELRALRPRAMIIRPTLIYGDPRLATVTALMRYAKSWPAMVMPGAGGAKVQPVFYEDLGRLCVGLLDSGAEGGTFAVGGPDIVTMRGLFEAVQAAVGVRRPIIPVTGAILKLAGAMGAGGFSAEQVARAERDRVALGDIPPEELRPRIGLHDGLSRLAHALKQNESIE